MQEEAGVLVRFSSINRGIEVVIFAFKPFGPVCGGNARSVGDFGMGGIGQAAKELRNCAGIIPMHKNWRSSFSFYSKMCRAILKVMIKVVVIVHKRVWVTVIKSYEYCTPHTAE